MDYDDNSEADLAKIANRPDEDAIVVRGAAERRPRPDATDDGIVRIDYLDPFGFGPSATLDAGLLSDNVDDTIAHAFARLARAMQQYGHVVAERAKDAARGLDEYASLTAQTLGELKTLRESWICAVLQHLGQPASDDQLAIDLGFGVARWDITPTPDDRALKLTLTIYGHDGKKPFSDVYWIAGSILGSPDILKAKLEFVRSVNTNMIAPDAYRNAASIPNPGGKLFDQLTTDERIILAMQRAEANAYKKHEELHGPLKVHYVTVRIRPYVYKTLAEIHHGFTNGYLDRSKVSVVKSGESVTLTPDNPTFYQYQSTWEQFLQELIEHVGIPFRDTSAAQGTPPGPSQDDGGSASG